jgi:hypothetical protein
LALAAAALVLASPASAQYSAAILACRFDAKGICGGTLPESGQLAGCIKRNFEKLAEPCQAALVGIATVREDCAADIEQQCPRTKPGESRLLFCVKAHYAALSEGCRDAIGQEAERNLRGQ